MQNSTDNYNRDGVKLAWTEPETTRQRTQQETNLLSLINPTLAPSLAQRQTQIAESVDETILDGQDVPEEEEEEVDDDEIDIVTDDEEGDMDIPKPLPKVLTPAQRKKLRRKERVLCKDRGPIFQTISPSDIPFNESSASSSKVTWDEDPEIICSYNWSSVVDGSNTIFVPGEPSKWNPPEIPYIVPGDKGFHPTDYNYARQPREPFSPVFHAMTIMNPEYSFTNIDVLADRNNLRTLLEFVQGKTVGPFRLDLYMVFSTLIIVRRDDGFWRHSNGNSYGFNFEKHFTQTAADMAGAAAHYRAIRYRMSPLNIVCRFEADAYVDTAPDILSESEAAATIPSAPAGSDLMNRPTFVHRAPFKVLQKGHLVPSHQILELKTQVDKPQEYQSPGPWTDQLWFGRTKNLFTGRYEARTGKILYLKQDDATMRLKRWEEQNQTGLQKLVALLTMLKGSLMKQKGPFRAAILVREDPRGPLTLHEMLVKKNLVQRQFFERHWMNHVKPKRNAQQGARGGGGQQAGRGRGEVRGGRTRGQAGGQRGDFAQRGHVAASGYPSHQPRGMTRGVVSGGRPKTDAHPNPALGNFGAGPRGGRSHRGRGRASRGGRGNPEQSGS